jgi:hypothetical protein
MLHRVKLVGKGASIRRGRVVVGGEGVLGVSVLMPSLLIVAVVPPDLGLELEERQRTSQEPLASRLVDHLKQTALDVQHCVSERPTCCSAPCSIC